MDGKYDWRNQGAKIKQERERLEAIIDTIPDDLSMQDIRDEILSAVKVSIHSLRLSFQLNDMSRNDARRLLGEIRFMKEADQQPEESKP